MNPVSNLLGDEGLKSGLEFVEVSFRLQASRADELLDELWQLLGHRFDGLPDGSGELWSLDNMKVRELVVRDWING